MNVNTSTKFWYHENGAEEIAKHFMDEDKIFTSDAGLQKGVYAAYVHVEGKDVLMYIGESGRKNRCIRDRLIEHAHYWIDNPMFYCGIKPEELKNDYKFKVKILAVEADDEKRYQFEQHFIENRRPYNQSGPYPKYDTTYRGLDLCIFPTYRRRAFLFARDGKVPMEIEVTSQNEAARTKEVISQNESVSQKEEEKKRLIVGILDDTQQCDWKKCKGTPIQEIADKVREEMPQGSKEHLAVKRKVDKALGFVEGQRGCYYKNLVEYVSNAVKDIYMSEHNRVSA